jgi:hypothetical protein
VYYKTFLLILVIFFQLTFFSTKPASGSGPFFNKVFVSVAGLNFTGSATLQEAEFFSECSQTYAFLSLAVIDRRYSLSAVYSNRYFVNRYRCRIRTACTCATSAASLPLPTCGTTPSSARAAKTRHRSHRYRS